ncbi:MAG: sulfatase-like hydrolase/transferase [Opitutales bacterium]
MKIEQYKKKGSISTALGLLVCGFLGGIVFADDRPNIVFILADDLGWGDFSSYGHPELETPNIDRIAEEGKLFTQFYVSSGVCSPSRVAFTTGQFPARHGVHAHFSSVIENQERNMPNYLDPTVTTLPRLLQESGYATAHFGKWHMSSWGADSDSPEPTAYGFDKSLGYLSTGPQLLEDMKKDPYFRAKTTEAIVDETIQFFKDNPDKPVFVNAWTLIPHTILNPTPEQMEPFMKFAPNIPGTPHAGAKVVYYSTIADFDTQLGRLVDTLDEMGVGDNTIIIITSDNGPEDFMLEGHQSSHAGLGSPGPFRGRKRSLYEGGIRVPLVVRWPAKMEADVVDDSVITAVDFLPTFAKIAGVELPAGSYVSDGEDMSLALIGDGFDRVKPLTWAFDFEMTMGHPIHKNPSLAIRDGDWKLLKNPDGSRVELYNIPNDIMEVDNVAKDYPGLVDQLSKKLMNWYNSMPQAPVIKEAGSNDYPWPGTF